MAKKLTDYELVDFPQPEYIRVDYPVLLCHGYGAFASIMRSGPMHDVCMTLRNHGIPAFAPNIVPYAKVEVRAGEWKEVIDEILVRTKAEKINIIAHSMSGLDIRYALYKFPDLTKKVKRVITVATPHYGTSLAELALKTPDFLKDNFLKLSDWIGNKIYPEIKSNTDGALKQLTRKYVQEVFNPEVGEPPVPLYSISAICGKGTDYSIPTVLRGFNHWIYDHEGVNDGFISDTSAQFGTYLKQIPYSHSEQILLNVSSDKRKEIQKMWTDLVSSFAEGDLIK